MGLPANIGVVIDFMIPNNFDGMWDCSNLLVDTVVSLLEYLPEFSRRQRYILSF